MIHWVKLIHLQEINNRELHINRHRMVITEDVIQLSNAEEESQQVECYKVTKRSKETKRITTEQKGKHQKEGELWNQRMDHVSAPYIQKLQYVSEGVKNVVCRSDKKNCKVYCQAKMISKSFTKDRESAIRVGKILHSNIMGPINSPTNYMNNKYIFCLLDNLFLFLQISLLKNKDEEASQLDLACHKICAKYFGIGQFNILHCDMETEYTSIATKISLEKYDLKLELAESYVHEYNGERLNRTL